MYKEDMLIKKREKYDLKPKRTKVYIPKTPINPIIA